jgi:hypothetical protein
VSKTISSANVVSELQVPRRLTSRNTWRARQSELRSSKSHTSHWHPLQSLTSRVSTRLRRLCRLPPVTNTMKNSRDSKRTILRSITVKALTACLPLWSSSDWLPPFWAALQTFADRDSDVND